MKICFPVSDNNGLSSQVFGHFGSASFFIICDVEAKSFEAIENQDKGHSHGMCNPIGAIGGNKVDAIVVGGIGAGAINKLNAAGIKVFRAFQGTVEENIKIFLEGGMPEMTVKHACGGHGGGCSH